MVGSPILSVSFSEYLTPHPPIRPRYSPLGGGSAPLPEKKGRGEGIPTTSPPAFGPGVAG